MTRQNSTWQATTKLPVEALSGSDASSTEEPLSPIAEQALKSARRHLKRQLLFPELFPTTLGVPAVSPTHQAMLAGVGSYSRSIPTFGGSETGRIRGRNPTMAPIRSTGETECRLMVTVAPRQSKVQVQEPKFGTGRKAFKAFNRSAKAMVRSLLKEVKRHG